MPALNPPVCDFGWSAPDFRLPATDGGTYARDDIATGKGLLVMFICNHCPFVKAIAEVLVRDVKLLQAEGLGVAAICSNDAADYPEDGFEAMKRYADDWGFTFPYLHDESQEVGRAYGAICTPDFFGFDGGLGLQYRGRLDDTRTGAVNPDSRRDLLEAMREIMTTGAGPRTQTPSIGCSIKWRTDDRSRASS